MGAALSPEAPTEATLHATTVAYDGHALLLRGAAGAGKSSLAMACIGLGAALVADDRTVLRRHGDEVRATAPAPLAGLIEIRGLGLLRLPARADVPVMGVLDLDTPEMHRLPPARTTALLGVQVALFHRIDGAHVAAALLQCMAGNRTEPQVKDDTTP